MRCSLVDKQHVLEVRELWSVSFGDSDDYMDFYFDNIYPYNIVFGAFDGNKLVSMIHLNPNKVYYCGRIIDTHYIVGVATRKEYRNQGIMRELMTACVEYLRNKGELFTFLMPEKKEYYIGQGFELLEKSYLIPFDLLLSNYTIKDDLSNYCIIGIDDISDIMLDDFNNMLIDRYDLFIPRDRDYLEMLDKQCISEGGRAYALCCKNKLISMFGMMKNLDAYECVEYISAYEDVRDILIIYKLLGITNYPTNIEIFGRCSREIINNAHVAEGKGIMYKILNNCFQNDLLYDKILCINGLV